MRIVHDNKKLIMILEDDSVNLATKKTVFEGTEEECQAEIERLNLEVDEDIC